MRLSKDVRISVSVVAARETRLFTLTALALTRTLTHGSKRWNMHCICRFESPYSWRVGSTEHFCGSVLLETFPSQAQRAKENSAKATLYQVFCYCCVRGGSRLSTHFGACSQQPAHTVMAEWHPTSNVENLARLRSENGWIPTNQNSIVSCGFGTFFFIDDNVKPFPMERNRRLERKGSGWG